MPRDEKLPQEAPVAPEDAVDAPDLPDDVPDLPDSAEPVEEPDTPDSAEPELVEEPDTPDSVDPIEEPDSPDSAELTEKPDSIEEPDSPAPKPRPVRMAHVLWRGFWLSVCILGIAVLMGRIDTFGVAWRRQPWRAFGGAVAVGGLLGALPGLLRRDLPERPRLRRCVLAVVTGVIWGVLG